MGKLFFLNDQARQYHAKNRHNTPSLIESSPVAAIIEAIASDPDVVAYAQLEQLGFTEVDIPEERIDAIEEAGLEALREDISREYAPSGLSESDFEAALEMCREDIRERYELD